LDTDRRIDAEGQPRPEESGDAADDRGPMRERAVQRLPKWRPQRRRALLDPVPELVQPLEARLQRIAGDDGAVDRADRVADHPVGLEPRLVHPLVHAAVVGAERAAALQHEHRLPVTRGHYSAVQPPSIESIAPVIAAAASLQRYAASAATSSTFTNSLVGCGARITSRITRSSLMPCAFACSGICLSTSGVRT